MISWAFLLSPYILKKYTEMLRIKWYDVWHLPQNSPRQAGSGGCSGFYKPKSTMGWSSFKLDDKLIILISTLLCYWNFP